VRWIDKVLEIALERMPTPLPEDEPVAATAPEAAIGPGQVSDAVKH
jgi:ATP-dependent Lon protease